MEKLLFISGFFIIPLEMFSLNVLSILNKILYYNSICRLAYSAVWSHSYLKESSIHHNHLDQYQFHYSWVVFSLLLALRKCSSAFSGIRYLVYGVVGCIPDIDLDDIKYFSSLEYCILIFQRDYPYLYVQSILTILKMFENRNSYSFHNLILKIITTIHIYINI